MNKDNVIYLGKIRKKYHGDNLKNKFSKVPKENIKKIKIPKFKTITVDLNNRNIQRFGVMFSIGIILFTFGYAAFQQKLSTYLIKPQIVKANDVVFTDSNSSSIKEMSKETYLTSNFKTIDKRTYVLDQFFKSRNSPLYGEGEKFVEACDKYGAPKDCITLAAIARHETDLCNYYNSAEMHNCIGWGGGGAYRQSFESFDQMIDVSMKVLVTQYGYDSMIDPVIMENVFCGPQAECDGWGDRIKSIMTDIDNLAVSLGVGRLTDLR